MKFIEIVSQMIGNPLETCSNARKTQLARHLYYRYFRIRHLYINMLHHFWNLRKKFQSHFARICTSQARINVPLANITDIQMEYLIWGESHNAWYLCMRICPSSLIRLLQHDPDWETETRKFTWEHKVFKEENKSVWIIESLDELIHLISSSSMFLTFPKTTRLFNRNGSKGRISKEIVREAEEDEEVQVTLKFLFCALKSLIESFQSFRRNSFDKYWWIREEEKSNTKGSSSLYISLKSEYHQKYSPKYSDV